MKRFNFQSPRPYTDTFEDVGRKIDIFSCGQPASYLVVSTFKLFENNLQAYQNHPELKAMVPKDPCHLVCID
ncbi:MAG: hypothetical protein HQL69_18945 [Magnetococcales bacterium]|nr:hypothetical protein [Magnetococcales bacterium]